jgi:hypothetical protein
LIVSNCISIGCILSDVFRSFYSEEYLELLINVLQQISPDQLKLDSVIREVLEEGRESFKNLSQNGAEGGAGAVNNETADSMSVGAVFMIWWKFIMMALLSGFFISCVSHFAQYYQMLLDQEDSNKLRRRLPNSVRLELASPTSGRLKLPPPTPVQESNAKLKEQQQLLSTAPHTISKPLPKTPAVFTFQKNAQSSHLQTPKTPQYQALRELQIADNNPMTPEATDAANVAIHMRKFE